MTLIPLKNNWIAGTYAGDTEWTTDFMSNFMKVSTQTYDYEVYEQDQSYTVSVNMPGKYPESLEVEVEGRVLTIRSENAVREGKRLVGNGSVAHSTFSVTLPFTPSTNAPEAEYAHGVLTVRFAKRQADRRRRIEVRVGE